MPKIKANGIDLYYEIHGRGDPLVLIMGLRRNAEWWYCQIPTLAKHFQVLVFDNRGAGRSDQPEMDYSISLFADDTAALMKSLGLASAHVLGISMGGYIAQELAIDYPEMVQGLVLGCTGSGGSRAVMMSQELLTKFTANQGLSPEDILRKDMDIYFSEGFIQGRPERIKEFIEISLRFYQPPGVVPAAVRRLPKTRYPRTPPPNNPSHPDHDRRRRSAAASRKFPPSERNDPPGPAGRLPRRPPLLLYGICPFIQSAGDRFPILNDKIIQPSSGPAKPKIRSDRPARVSGPKDIWVNSRCFTNPRSARTSELRPKPVLKSR